MKKALFSLLSAVLLTINIQTVSAAEPVHAGTRILQSGGLIVEVGDPDSPDCRWNKGLRFSPVANIIQPVSGQIPAAVIPGRTNRPYKLPNVDYGKKCASGATCRN